MNRCLKDAHAALDAAVLSAYGFSAKKDLLARLLELNLSVAQHLEQAKPVTPPGIPATFPNPATLISDDCIRPPALALAFSTRSLRSVLLMNCHAKRLECVELAPSFGPPHTLPQRQQAGRTPNASRNSVAA